MRRVAVLAGLALAAGVAACGGDEKSERDTARDTARQQAQDFQRRAGEICTDVNDRIVGMEGRIAEKIRTERDPAVVARLDARVFQRYDTFVQELVRRLEEVDAQAPDKAAFRSYLARLRKLGRLSRSESEDMLADRPGVAGLDAIGTNHEKAEDEANRLGLGPCAELSSPALTGKA